MTLPNTVHLYRQLATVRLTKLSLVGLTHCCVCCCKCDDGGVYDGFWFIRLDCLFFFRVIN